MNNTVYIWSACDLASIEAERDDPEFDIETMATPMGSISLKWTEEHERLAKEQTEEDISESFDSLDSASWHDGPWEDGHGEVARYRQFTLIDPATVDIEGPLTVIIVQERQFWV